MAQLDETADLRYLAAQNVRGPAGGSLAGYRVWTADARSLGTVDGVLFSPTSHRLAYLVVGSRGLFEDRRYLLPVSAGAVMEEGHPRTLRVSARRDELDLQAFTPRSVLAYADQEPVTKRIA